MSKNPKISLTSHLQEHGGFSPQQCGVLLDILEDVIVACAKEGFDLEVGSLFDITTRKGSKSQKLIIRKKLRFSQRLSYFGKDTKV